MLAACGRFGFDPLEIKWSVDISDDASGTGLARLGEETLVVGGFFKETVDFGGGPRTSSGCDDMFVLALDLDGNYLWDRVFGGAGCERLLSLAVHQQRIFFGGSYDTATSAIDGDWVHRGATDAFLMALSDSGEIQWSEVWGEFGDDVVSSLDSTSTGIAVSGWIEGDQQLGSFPLLGHGAEDILAALFDPTGAVIWAASFGGTHPDRAFDIQGASPGVVVSGQFQDDVDFGAGLRSSVDEHDAFTLRLDATGNPLWDAGWGDVDADQARSSAVDAAGAVIVAGFAEPRALRAHVEKFDSSGQSLWKLTASDVTAGSSNAEAVALFEEDIFVSGGFEGTLRLGEEEHTTTTRQSWIAKLDSDGNVLRTLLFGDGIEIGPNNLTALADGDIITVGVNRLIVYRFHRP
jgi:hypothetical protein